ncbi:MAG: competence/damage-inducible protein A [Gemmatimonadales bacterium]|nr:MAG: competence/damage-inducible protein A [Gemmatimonadales bacterium]
MSTVIGRSSTTRHPVPTSHTVDFELVTIGTELLLGLTIDTNGAYLGTQLAEVGIVVTRRSTIPDDPLAIEQAVRDALARTGAVITTGGLGPTQDDITKPAVARVYGVRLRFEDTVWDEIVSRFRRLGREPAGANRTQAEVPEGAEVLRNRWGTAPGLWLDGEPGLTVMLPGVPKEMRGLLDQEVIPRLQARGAGTVVRSLSVRTTSIPESSLAERLHPVEKLLPPLTLAYLPSTRGVDLRLTAWGVVPDQADRLLAEAAARLEDALEGFAYGRGDQDLAEVVVERFRGAGRSVAIAESCTGGLLGARLTGVAGASAVFIGGVVCYQDILKHDLLGVSQESLAAHGAVSVEVAEEMARGVRVRLGAYGGVAITGIAGPTGGTPEKPVGTVCIAWSIGPQSRAVRFTLLGNREEIRDRAAQAALHGLLRPQYFSD